MKRNFLGLVVVIASIAGCRCALAGDILDRIVATVNGHIILQSDWENALRYTAFVDGRALGPVPTEERKAALDRLIDQELLQEQLRSSDLPHVTQDDVRQRVQEIRSHHSGTETEQGWQDALHRYGLTQDELQRQVALDVDLMRLVDARLRPGVSIDSRSIESYYNQELLPQLRQTGKGSVPLAEATPKIKELLTQQKMNQLLLAWLQNLRSGSQIQTEPVAEGSQGELR
jgi:hypothetical protein